MGSSSSAPFSPPPSKRSTGEPIQLPRDCEVKQAVPWLGSIDFDAMPFAHGRFRAAFKGVVYVRGNAPLAKDTLKKWRGCGWQPQSGSRDYACVVKMFKDEAPIHKESWFPDIKALDKASELAKRFNNNIKPSIAIKFAKSFLYKITSIGHISGGNGRGRLNEVIAAEPYLQGEYVKVNSNNGFVSAGYDLEAQAFSHWTWSTSGGRLLVCDLQGVRQHDGAVNCWMFTDPAIHSEFPGKFGLTDLGRRGQNAFFRSHLCNPYCAHLKKPAVLPEMHIKPSRSSSYTFEYVFCSTMVHDQAGGTCYAHAVATVVRAAENRIAGRMVDPHEVVVKSLVERFGSNGANTEHVLKVVCPPRHLQYKQIDSLEAQNIVHIGRPVLLTFRLTNDQWPLLSSFFFQNPLATLEAIPPAETHEKSGHAVVIIGREGPSWKIKNSWGESFADHGFFRVSRHAFDTLDATRYFDIFWHLHELDSTERRKLSIAMCANAFAWVIRAAESRIVGRKVEDTSETIQELIGSYYLTSVSTEAVLKQVLPARRLQFRTMNKRDAEAIACPERPVLACFHDMTDKEYSDIFACSLQGSRTADRSVKQDDAIFDSRRYRALVIIGKNGANFNIKDPWCIDSARFACLNCETLDSYSKVQYIDICWHVNDLVAEELHAWDNRKQ